MILLCSIISIIVIVGHLISIYLNQNFWPFVNYPMYSFPISQIKYPIVIDGRLIMLNIVDTSNGKNREMLFNQHLPKDFHPFDRLEVVVFLKKAIIDDEDLKTSQNRHTHHFKWDFTDSQAFTPTLQEAAKALLAFAKINTPEIQSIKIEKLEWNDYQNQSTRLDQPDKKTTLIEVSDD